LEKIIQESLVRQKRDEVDKIKQLEAEKRQLEAALAKSNLDKFCLECLIEAAEETYGVSFKKNFGTQALKKGGKE